jgi:hypothetical protein
MKRSCQVWIMSNWLSKQDRMRVKVYSKAFIRELTIWI